MAAVTQVRILVTAHFKKTKKIDENCHVLTLYAQKRLELMGGASELDLQFLFVLSNFHESWD